MNTNQLVNASAIAFAVFAVYVFTRGSTAQARTLVSTQPGQVQRDVGAQLWMDQIARQFDSIYRYGAVGNTNDFSSVTPANALDTWLSRGSSGD